MEKTLRQKDVAAPPFPWLSLGVAQVEEQAA